MASRRFLFALVAASLVGCEAEPFQELITVTSIAPREVERGDRLELGGSGFPEGRSARIVFRGELHRPGESTRSDVAIDALGMARGPDAVDFTFDVALEDSFCGTSADASHTTFHGDIDVVFPGAARGAPPVHGVLRGVTLDMTPSRIPPSRSTANITQANRFATYLGVAFENDAHIKEVFPGSRAARAGLLPNDRVTSSGGMLVTSLADLAPAPGERESVVHVQRSGADITTRVPLEGLSPDTRARWPIALIAIVAVFVVALFGPPAGAFALLRWRLRRRDAAPRLARDAERVTAAVLIASFVVAHVFGRAVDLGLVLLASFVAWLGAAFVRADSVRNALRNVGAAFSLVVPQAIVATWAMLALGSLRAEDVLRGQTAMPWTWFGFSSPAHTLALFAFLVPCAVRVTSDDLRLKRAWTLLTACAASLIFLGGFAPPTSGAMGTLLGGLLFAAKAGAVSIACGRIATSFAPCEPRTVAKLGLFLLTPLAAGSTLFARWWSDRIDRSTSSIVTVALLLTVTMVTAYITIGVARRARTTELSPFL